MGRKCSWIRNFLTSVSTLADRGTSRSPAESREVLFLLKVVMNLPAQFGLYASHFVVPLAKVAAQEGHNGGKGIHYLVRDMCSTILRWIGERSLRTEQPLGYAMEPINLLVNHLIKAVLSHVLTGPIWRRIYVCNLTFIQDFVELYGMELRVKRSAILGHLTSSTGSASLDAKYANAGIQILSCCLGKVDLVQDGVSMDEIYTQLIELLKHRTKAVWVPAAEVLSQALQLNLKDDSLGIRWKLNKDDLPPGTQDNTVRAFPVGSSTATELSHVAC